MKFGETLLHFIPKKKIIWSIYIYIITWHILWEDFLNLLVYYAYTKKNINIEKLMMGLSAIFHKNNL